jgi:hypothetical protein
MPETKHNFTGGKMNKDLDERLVPNGEYRDAMNIQVSTSEESNVGTVQNILGNKAGCNSYTFDFPRSVSSNDPTPLSVNFVPSAAIQIGSKVVGSISDEKNDTLYWLISGDKSLLQGGDISSHLSTVGGFVPGSLPIRFKDMIMRKTPDFCQPVFVDKYGLVVSNAIVDQFNVTTGFTEQTITNTIELQDPSLLPEVNAGMFMKAYKKDGSSTEPTKVTAVGSITEITTPYSLNYDVIPQQPIFREETAIAAIPGGLQEVTIGQTNSNLGTAFNKIIIPVTQFPGDLKVGDIIDVSLGGDDVVNSNNAIEFLTPQIADNNGNIFSPGPIDAAVVTSISQPITHTNFNGDFDATSIEITISQTLIDPITNSPYQSNIVQNYLGGGQASVNYLSSPSFPNALVKCNIRFISTPEVLQVNNIVTLPQDGPWLNEIYDIFYPDGINLDPNIEVRIQPNGEWTEFPAGSGSGGCINPSSISPPNLTVSPPVYDNEFSVMECGGGIQVLPPQGIGNRIGPTNTIFTLTVHDTSTNTSTPFGDNLISLANTLDLTSGYDYFHFYQERVLNYEHDKLITGINILDDILLWVDGVGTKGTEPKKINIQRSIRGTFPDSNRHTLLVNDVLNYNPQDIQIPITKEHITVIKRSPQNPPNIDLSSSRQGKSVTGIVRVSNALDPNASAATPDPNNDIIAPSIFDFSAVEPGDTITLKINEDIDGNSGVSSFEFDWKVGDNVVLKEFDENGDQPQIPITDYTIKAQIIESSDNTIRDNKFKPDDFGYVGSVLVHLKIQAIKGFPPGPIGNNPSRKYAIDLFEEDEKIFEFKFPRFAYRYKYEDGEYSAYSPFSQPAFLAGSFDYHPKKGFNLGMTNRAKSVVIKDFVNETTPYDVVEIDILYKEDASPNVYLVDTIKPDDEAVNQDFNSWMSNSYEITSDTINAVLPSNQLLRPWDNVPKKAQAQEVTGNRIVYANYFQNFDLKAGLSNKNYYPDFRKSITKFKDVKSSAVRSII